jgi:hypothetical protein
LLCLVWSTDFALDICTQTSKGKGFKGKAFKDAF